MDISKVPTSGDLQPEQSDKPQTALEEYEASFPDGTQEENLDSIWARMCRTPPSPRTNTTQSERTVSKVESGSQREDDFDSIDLLRSRLKWDSKGVRSETFSASKTTKGGRIPRPPLFPRDALLMSSRLDSPLPELSDLSSLDWGSPNSISPSDLSLLPEKERHKAAQQCESDQAAIIGEQSSNHTFTLSPRSISPASIHESRSMEKLLDFPDQLPAKKGPDFYMDKDGQLLTMDGRSSLENTQHQVISRAVYEEAKLKSLEGESAAAAASSSTDIINDYLGSSPILEEETWSEEEYCVWKPKESDSLLGQSSLKEKISDLTLETQPKEAESITLSQKESSSVNEPSPSFVDNTSDYIPKNSYLKMSKAGSNSDSNDEEDDDKIKLCENDEDGHLSGSDSEDLPDGARSEPPSNARSDKPEKEPEKSPKRRRWFSHLKGSKPRRETENATDTKKPQKKKKNKFTRFLQTFRKRFQKKK